jgi:hypothetical protein
VSDHFGKRWVVLVGQDLTVSPGPAPTLPAVVAHNLTREEAQQLHARLTCGGVDGYPIGVTTYILECEGPHARTDASNCLECGEIVSDHCRQMLSLLEQERQKRSAE